MTEDSLPILFVCTTCKPPGRVAEVPAHGQRLYDAVAARLGAAGDEAPVRAVPIVCFGNCEQGCSAGMSAPGKWSYLMGRLTPEHAADLVTWGEAYGRSPNGTVLRSGRPASLRDTIVARFPSENLAPNILRNGRVEERMK